MTASFRHTKSIRIQTLVVTAFFVALMLAFSTTFFVDDATAKNQGFIDRHSAVRLTWVSEVGFGFMLLGSVYTVLAAYMGRVSVADMRISIRSAFQNRQFDATAVDRLVWKVGALAIYVENRKVSLGLAWFNRADRLAIIRLLRRLIPESKQEGWPRFCQWSALPLRDGGSAIRMALLATSNLSDDSFVTLHRSRYNWFGYIVIPAATIVAFGYWWKTGEARLFAVLPIAICSFIILRYSVSRGGSREMRMSADPTFRLFLLVLGYSVAIMLAMIVGIILGPSRVGGERFLNFVVYGAGVGLLPVVYAMFRHGRRIDRLVKATTAAASEKWEMGESNSGLSAS